MERSCFLTECHGSITTKDLFDVSLVDDSFGFAVGYGLYKFDGESWSLVNENIWGVSIELYSRNFGIILDGWWTYIYNGTHWKRLIVDTLYGSIFLGEASIVNDSVAFAVGEDVDGPSVVYRYQNNSWSLMNEFYGGSPTSISMFNETLGLIVGYGMDAKGIVWKYNGTALSRQSIPEVGILSKVLMLSPDRAFAFGDGPTILRYDGVAWTVEQILQDNAPPFVQNPFQELETVLPNETVTILVNVTDAESGVGEVTLSYTADDGVTWTNATMKKTAGDTYTGWIPGFLNGTNVKYKITAYDRAKNFYINDNEGNYFTYIVVPEFPSWTVLLLTLFALTLPFIYILNMRRKRYSDQCPVKNKILRDNE